MNVIRKSELSVYIGIRFIRDFVEGTLLEKAGSIKYVRFTSEFIRYVILSRERFYKNRAPLKFFFIKSEFITKVILLSVCIDVA